MKEAVKLLTAELINEANAEAVAAMMADLWIDDDEEWTRHERKGRNL